MRLARANEQPKSQIARDLGISVWTLRNWIKRAEIDAGERTEAGRFRCRLDSGSRVNREVHARF